MTEPVSGVENSPERTRAPAEAGTYDPERRLQVQAFVPGPEQHFKLPDEVSKGQAVVMTCRALRLLGAGERAIAVWRHLADMTERQAWHAVDRSPVNWKRQCDLAREMGLGERQFRRIEVQLARFGALARTTADNGYRGRRSGQPFRGPISCGLSLGPALANFQAFARIVEEAELAEETRQEAVLDARIARRRIGLLTASLDDIEMRRWARSRLGELDESARPARPRVASTEELSLWHADLLALEDAIREALAPFSAPDTAPSPEVDAEGANLDVSADRPHTRITAGTRGRTAVASGDGGPNARNSASLGGSTESDPVENVQFQRDMSAAPDIGVRCHIQPTTESGSICKAPGPPADHQSGYGSAPESPFRHREVGPELEGSPLSQTLAARLTVKDISGLASDDVAIWLDAFDDWRDALPHILRELGTNISAWHDACDAMGETVAFLALLVIDRNRFHPDAPILNPGGALRAFTRRARIGELDLTRSILGIWERERQGRQPRGPLTQRRQS